MVYSVRVVLFLYLNEYYQYCVFIFALKKLTVINNVYREIWLCLTCGKSRQFMFVISAGSIMKAYTIHVHFCNLSLG